MLFVQVEIKLKRIFFQTGTAHLAQKQIKCIYKNQKNLFEDGGVEYFEKMKSLVGLAGLLHDLGHGPFSHMFDNILIPRIK